MAMYVESGRGVIASVHADMLYNGRLSNRDFHAVTVTATVRNPDGSIKGFYICDSNEMPSQFYSAEIMQKSLSGRCMNVTSQIIR